MRDNRERAEFIHQGIAAGDVWDEKNWVVIKNALDEAEVRGEAKGRKAGLEEAAKFTEDYGLELFAKADGTVSLRHGAVLLSSFAIKIRGLGPLGTELEK